MDPFVGQIELCNRLPGDIVDDMQLRTGLVRVSGWKRSEKPTQPEHSCIGDEDFAEPIELWSDGVSD